MRHLNSVEVNRLYDIDRFVSRFVNGIGPNTLEAEIKIYDPEYVYPENQQTLKDMIKLLEKGLIRKIQLGGLPIYFSRSSKVKNYQVLYPNIKELGPKSKIFDVWPIYVSNSHSFFARFSTDRINMQTVSNYIRENKAFSGYERLREKDIVLNVFYIYYNQKDDCYLRVRTERWCIETGRLVCTLCDVGGVLLLLPNDLIDLPMVTDPSVDSKAPRFAVNCIVDMKCKYNRFPQSRRGLRLCLTRVDSQEQTIVENLCKPMKVQFLEYKSDLNAFVVQLYTEDLKPNFYESIVQKLPIWISIDRFYATNMDYGNYFGNYTDPEKGALEFHIKLEASKTKKNA